MSQKKNPLQRILSSVTRTFSSKDLVVDDHGWFHVGVVNCDLCDEPAEYYHPEGGMRCKTCVRP